MSVFFELLKKSGQAIIENIPVSGPLTDRKIILKTGVFKSEKIPDIWEN